MNGWRDWRCSSCTNKIGDYAYFHTRGTTNTGGVVHAECMEAYFASLAKRMRHTHEPTIIYRWDFDVPNRRLMGHAVFGSAVFTVYVELLPLSDSIKYFTPLNWRQTAPYPHPLAFRDWVFRLFISDSKRTFSVVHTSGLDKTGMVDLAKAVQIDVISSNPAALQIYCDNKLKAAAAGQIETADSMNIVPANFSDRKHPGIYTPTRFCRRVAVNP